jgi:hypothetical protein
MSALLPLLPRSVHGGFLPSPPRASWCTDGATMNVLYARISGQDLHRAGFAVRVWLIRYGRNPEKPANYGGGRGSSPTSTRLGWKSALRIPGLAGATSGARVLDLGCGRCLTVPHLLAAAGASGEVVAVDRMRGSLAAIRDRYSATVAIVRCSHCRSSRKSSRSVFPAGGDRRMRLRFHRNRS